MLNDHRDILNSSDSKGSKPPSTCSEDRQERHIHELFALLDDLRVRGKNFSHVTSSTSALVGKRVIHMNKLRCWQPVSCRLVSTVKHLMTRQMGSTGSSVISVHILSITRTK
jgi:hypothetical protein